MDHRTKERGENTVIMVLVTGITIAMMWLAGKIFYESYLTPEPAPKVIIEKKSLRSEEQMEADTREVSDDLTGSTTPTEKDPAKTDSEGEEEEE